MDIQQSYYNYVVNIERGSLFISNKLREEDYDKALQAIVDFSEGIEWLLNAEALMLEQSYTIDSNVQKVTLFMNDINECLVFQDFITLADLFEYEIAPLFHSASNWIFQKGMKE